MHDEITQEDISVLNVRIPAVVRSNCLRDRIKPENVFTRHSEGFFPTRKTNWTSRHIPAVCQRDGNC